MKENTLLRKEEKLAIELINEKKINNLKQLEIEFQEKNIPLREKYAYYYISLMHQQNPEDKKLWRTENCKFEFYDVKTSWWEKYLKYERPLKQKIRLENNPDLSILNYFELNEILNDEKLHTQFIKLGWNYKNQMDLYFEKTSEIDIENENANWNIENAKSIFQIHNELSDIKRKFDPKPKISFIERKSNENSEYCEACQQSPCMCSDPY